MDSGFNPLALTPDYRKDYQYEGPEVIYVFWAKHGPCQMTGCGHRTPILGDCIVSVKSLTVTAWTDFRCESCGEEFDVEERIVQMGPSAPLIVADGEKPFSILGPDTSVVCPLCNHRHSFPDLKSKGSNKKIDLTLLVAPPWLEGAQGFSPDGVCLGGAAQDSAAATSLWNDIRCGSLRLIEVRGLLPEA